jgi:hypothetical protein
VTSVFVIVRANTGQRVNRDDVESAAILSDRFLPSARQPMSTVSPQPLRDLLPRLDTKLNDLMLSLYRTRELLGEIQQQPETDAVMLTRLGAAIASVRTSERVLANIQHAIDMCRDQQTPFPSRRS